MAEPFAYRMPVRFADIDHAGIVYYPRFFHYFHLGFEEMLRARMGPGKFLELVNVDRIGFPAVASECQYVSPLRFGDVIEVQVSLVNLGGRSMRFRYRIYRIDESGGEAPVLAADGTTTCAVVDLDRLRPVPVPEHLKELLSDLLESAG